MNSHSGRHQEHPSFSFGSLAEAWRARDEATLQMEGGRSGYKHVHGICRANVCCERDTVLPQDFSLEADATEMTPDVCISCSSPRAHSGELVQTQTHSGPIFNPTSENNLSFTDFIFLEPTASC